MFRAHCLCFFLFVLYINTSWSQQPVFQWAVQFGSSVLSDTWYDNGRSIAVDEQGNVYSAGLFFHDVDFDPGPGKFMMTAQGPFDEAVYISKLSATGQFIWAKQIPLEISGPIYITVDHHANVYLTAAISRVTDMDPGSATYNAQPVGPQDALLLKLDSDGNFMWEKQFGAPGNKNGAAGYAIDVDRNDNVILTGSFYGAIDVDPGTTVYSFAANTNSEVFLVKLTPIGDFIWAKHLGSYKTANANVVAEDIKCDNVGNIYVAGSYSGICNFDPDVTNYSLQKGGGFVCKYNANGNLQWAKQIGAYSSYFITRPVGIDVDGAGNVYTSGTFYGTEDFDPGSSINTLTSNGSMDAFILKLTSQGDFAWAKNIGGADVDYSYDIATDYSGNVYMIGLYYGNIDFDPGPNNHTVCCLYDGTVILKLDTDGNYIFAPAFNRPINSNNGTCTGRRIVVDDLQNIYMTGMFGGSVEFDPTHGVYILNEGRGFADAFIVKLAKCTNSTQSTLDITSCDSYTINNRKYDSSGRYVQIIPNTLGCDSVITINLTINKKFTSQIKSICEGGNFYAGGALQTKAGIYIDTLRTILGCDSIVTTNLIVNAKPNPDLGNNKNLCEGNVLNVTPGLFSSYTWQDGSSQENFIINKTGLYWVTVTNSNNCSATDTIQVTTVSLPSNFLKAQDSVCSYQTLNIRSSQAFSNYIWSTGETQNNIVVQTAGIYWLKVTDINGCAGTDTITVLPKQCMKGVYVPTAFSPNKDGKNDFFHPLVFGKIKKYHFVIYNRWGQNVFETTDANKAWDGTIAGVLQDPAVFTWVCIYQLEGEEAKKEKGTITLVR